MLVTLIKVYTETDDHSSDVEMFRVYKIKDLLIEPKLKQKITLENDVFYVNQVEQNLKLQTIQLYEHTDIPHYEFWSKKKEFREKYLPPFLKRGWIELMRGEVAE